jgi:DNA invertase Pin-like site-specific DNA recombinase
MVAAWSVDRLVRSLVDLLDFLRELHAKGVDRFLHQQGLDTSTPSGRAMFQTLGVFAGFERRRRLEDSDADKVAAIIAARAKGIRRIARDLGIVLRVSDEAAYPMMRLRRC